MGVHWRTVALVACCLTLRGTSLSGDETVSGQPPASSRQELLGKEREAKRGSLAPYVVSRAERRVRFLETLRLPRRLFAKGFGGFRPVIGGMPAGSGFVAGGGYIAGYNSETALFTTDARISTKGFRAFDVDLRLFPSRRSRLPIEGRLTARAIDFPSLRHFGTGGSSRKDDRLEYRLESESVKAGLEVRPGRFGAFGGTLQLLSAKASPGIDLESRLEPLDTPGIGVRTNFVAYGGHGELRWRDRDSSPEAGVTLRAEASRYVDQDSGRFSFTRLVGEAQAIIPLGHRNRVLAFRARTSHSLGKRGSEVPFYLMETLGGARSIRGYEEYRFRAARNLLLNAEYRWEVWTYVDLTLFCDTGKVFSDRRDLHLGQLETGCGVGLRAHAPGGFVLRIDLARSNEGIVLHTGWGPRF